MVLKLYGYSGGYPRQIAVVLHEKKVPFEFILVDMMGGEHKSPKSLEFNPFGQVPYIDDNGFMLYESRAIAKYICAKYPEHGPALIPNPSDIEATAKFDQAMCLESFHFTKFGIDALVEGYFKKTRGLEPDQEAMKKHLLELDGKLDVYNKILSKQRYLTGDDITLADLFHLNVGAMLPLIGSNAMESKPNVARWWKDLTSRPSWIILQDGTMSTSEYD